MLYRQSSTIDGCEPLVRREFLTITRYLRPPVSRESTVGKTLQKRRKLSGWKVGTAASSPLFLPSHRVCDFESICNLSQLHEGFSFDLGRGWETLRYGCPRKASEQEAVHDQISESDASHPAQPSQARSAAVLPTVDLLKEKMEDSAPH